jgi:hypothetical protein
VERRYQEIAGALNEMGLTKEAGWVRRQLGSIKKQREKNRIMQITSDTNEK